MEPFLGRIGYPRRIMRKLDADVRSTGTAKFLFSLLKKVEETDYRRVEPIASWPPATVL